MINTRLGGANPQTPVVIMQSPHTGQPRVPELHDHHQTRGGPTPKPPS